jgi:methylamine dehydrogenase accessory protein MauD
MDALALPIRLLLAATFGLAGTMKLADLPGAASAMRSFGVPERLARLAGRALPIAELGIALLLLPVPTAWWAALAGLGLLLAFIAGIAVNLVQGRTPDCHCFGQVHSAPIGRPTLLRNGLLALLAAFLVLRGPARQGASLVAWLDHLSAAEGILLGLVTVTTGAVAAMAWLLIQVLQQNGRLLLRIEALEMGRAMDNQPGTADATGFDVPVEGLPTGTRAPGFALPDLAGDTVTLDALRAAGRPVVLLFIAPGCGSCVALLPGIGRWQRERADEMTLAVISRGTPEAHAATATEHGLHRVLRQPVLEVSGAYRMQATPSAVLIRADGTIGAPAAVGAEAIRALINQVATMAMPT